MKRLATALFILVAVVCDVSAAEVKLPESLQGLKETRKLEKGGRKVIRYEHGKHYFYYLPCLKTKNPPLRVILHHAGGSGDQCLNEAFKVKHRHQYATEEFAVLYLDCRHPKWGNWWWGWDSIKGNRAGFKGKLQAAEQRVLDTVQWIIKKYGIDKERVYLSGRSMGGSGSLGIGYSHGNIFAAMLVNVPAGAGHMLYRLKDGKYPDPPPTVNTSSQTDRWSKGQEDMLAYCKENKLPMIFAWEPFGHKSRPNEANAAVYDFPWLNIRKNEAYPVFTNSTSDDTYPGHMNKSAKDQRGQINGYYRWKNITDKKDAFVMELRLVKRTEIGKAEEIPSESTADVTLRRLQEFKVGPGESFNWKVVVDKKTLQKGLAKADNKGLLTIPGIKITAKPLHLEIRP